MVHYIKRIQFTTTILNLTFLGSQIRLVCFFTFFLYLKHAFGTQFQGRKFQGGRKFLKDMEKEMTGILCYLIIQLALCSQS